MTRRLTWLALLTLALPLRAFCSEIVTVLGQPDFGLEFVHKMVSEHVKVRPDGKAEEWHTTAFYSVLDRRGVHTSTNFDVMAEAGAATIADLLKAIELGVSRAPVMTTSLGPESASTCAKMGAHPEVAFVISIGSSSMGDQVPARCLYDNILRVGSLNEAGTDLATRSNYGRGLRVAAPGTRIAIIGPGGKAQTVSGGSFATARVAGDLAVFARVAPTLRGGTLIQAFLDRETEVLPSLVGKVEGGRVVKDRNW